MSLVPSRLVAADDDGHFALVWDWPMPVQVLSSAPVNGGMQTTSWLLNIGVSKHYDRTDLGEHAAEVASELGLSGVGVALFTAADVRAGQRAMSEGVVADVTVGISKPTWAADSADAFTEWMPGTINVVIQVPVALAPAAAVNAVMTATEAKTQALHEAGVPGTGTASDAVVITWPASPAGAVEPFGGPRSEWGSRIGRAVHEAVATGIERWQQP